VHILRRGAKQIKTVNFGKRITYEREELDRCEQAFLGVRQSYRPHEEGVQVSIVKNSTAEAVGMEDADILTAINGNRILDWEDITIALSSLRAGDRIEVAWLRDNRRRNGGALVKSRCDLEREREERETIIYEEGERQARGIEDVSIRSLTSYEILSLNQATGLDLPTDNTLGVKNLDIAPNEGGGLNLSLQLPQRGETSLQLYNDQGRLVYQYDLGDFSGQVTDRISLSGNSGGVFFLHISQNGKSLTRKVLVQRD